MRIKDGFGAARPPVSGGSTSPMQQTEGAARETQGTSRVIVTGSAPRRPAAGGVYYAACPFSKAAVMQSGAAENEWLITTLVALAQAGNAREFDKAARIFGQIHGVLGVPVDPSWGTLDGKMLGYVLGRLQVVRTIPAVACTPGELYALAADVDDLSVLPPAGRNPLWTWTCLGAVGAGEVAFESGTQKRTWPMGTLMVSVTTIGFLRELLSAGRTAVTIASEIIGGNTAMKDLALKVANELFPCTEEEARKAMAEAEAAGEAERLAKERAVKDQLDRNARVEAQREVDREAYRASLRAWQKEMENWRATGMGAPKSPLGAAAAMAAAGFLVGGPVGAAAGGVVGLLAGGGGGEQAMPPVQPGKPAWMSASEASSIVVGVMSELTVQ